MAKFGMDIGKVLGTNPNLLGKAERSKDSRRSFTKTQKNEIWERQNGRCAKCPKKLDTRTVEYDHIKPWADKGKTILENGEALCANCHKLKSHSDKLKKFNKKKKQSAEKNIFGIPTPKNTFLV